MGSETERTAAHLVDVHVGQKIRIFRSERNLSQSMLAEKLGVTFQQIQKYESGANQVGASKLFGIAKALDIEVAAFFTDLPQASQSRELSSRALERAAFASASEGVRLIEAFRTLPAHQRRMTLGMILALAECSRAQRDEGARGAERFRSTAITFR